MTKLIMHTHVHTRHSTVHCTLYMLSSWCVLHVTLVLCSLTRNTPCTGILQQDGREALAEPQLPLLGVHSPVHVSSTLVPLVSSTGERLASTSFYKTGPPGCGPTRDLFPPDMLPYPLVIALAYAVSLIMGGGGGGGGRIVTEKVPFYLPLI